MAAIGHKIITEAALATLPAWQQERWASEKEGLIAEYCLIPDLF